MQPSCCVYSEHKQHPLWCRWLAYLPFTQDTRVRVPVRELLCFIEVCCNQYLFWADIYWKSSINIFMMSFYHASWGEGVVCVKGGGKENQYCKILVKVHSGYCKSLFEIGLKLLYKNKNSCFVQFMFVTWI